MSYADTLNGFFQEAEGKVKTAPGEALKAVLNEMPVREKKAQGDIPKDNKDEISKEFTKCKDIAAKNVLTILTSIEKAKLAKAIQELNDDERDTLMKFVYRGFEEEYDHMFLLTVHDEICKVSGLGPVIRSIHTRLEV